MCAVFINAVSLFIRKPITLAGLVIRKLHLSVICTTDWRLHLNVFITIPVIRSKICIYTSTNKLSHSFHYWSGILILLHFIFLRRVFLATLEENLIMLVFHSKFLWSKVVFRNCLFFNNITACCTHISVMNLYHM